VDTNGAGDTFLSGVFLQMLIDNSLKEIFMEGNTELLKKAVSMGNYLAALTIQVDGVG